MTYILDFILIDTRLERIMLSECFKEQAVKNSLFYDTWTYGQAHIVCTFPEINQASGTATVVDLPPGVSFQRVFLNHV